MNTGTRKLAVLVAALALLITTGCSFLGSSGNAIGSKVDIDKCPEPGQYEDEVIVCVANDLWKGEVFVVRPSGGLTRLGMVRTGGDVHSYTIGSEEGKVMRFGVRFDSGSPADTRHIYVQRTDSFSASNGDVVFFHMMGVITYRNTRSMHVSPLDKSQIFINFIPDRFTADSESN